jgi:TonB family protein
MRIVTRAFGGAALGGIALAAAAQGAELVVQWRPIAGGANAYQVERRPGDWASTFLPIARVDGGATRFLDRTVTPGVRYCYRVRALRGGRMSRPSRELCSVATERPGPASEGASAVPAIATGPAEDREVMALRQPPPAYPPEAQLRGISGWVRLRFTVTASGATRDIEVVDSEPRGVFEKAATRAAQQFVYLPRLENGVSVDRPNVETDITFTWMDRDALVTDRWPAAPR